MLPHPLFLYAPLGREIYDGYEKPGEENRVSQEGKSSVDGQPITSEHGRQRFDVPRNSQGRNDHYGRGGEGRRTRAS